MKFTNEMLYIVRMEAESKLLGRKVKSVFVDERNMSLAITFQKNVSFFAKVRLPNIRAYLTDTSYPATPSWTNVMKNYTLVEMNQPLNDRILELHFRRRNPLGEPEELTLHLEFTGRYGNAILVKNGKVLRILKENLSERRKLRIGSPFVPYEAKEHTIDIERIKHLRFYVCDGELVMDTEVHKECLEFKTLSEALRFVYTYMEENDTSQETSDELRKLEERRKKFEEYSRKYYNIAQYIMSNLHNLSKGDVLNIEGLEIPIEDPIKQAQRFFKLYKGYRKALEEIELRVVRSKEVKQEGKPYYEYTSPSGYKVLVGKNASANDYILRKLANPEDMWFHVKDHPGAHVLLKCGKGKVDEDDILFCSKLALKHSKLSRSGKGTVSYTRVKYLRKPKGAPPGAVLLSKEDTIYVRLS